MITTSCFQVCSSQRVCLWQITFVSLAVCPCRMIVLLHAYNLGFSAWQVAIMFSLYELAGVVTNLLAGLMGARWGIKTTLLTGGHMCARGCMC